MKQSFVFLMVFFLGLSSVAQELLSYDSTTIVQLKDDQILTNKGVVLFSFQGNIIFEGNTNKADQIYYTLDGSDLFGKKKISVYDKKGRNDIWSIKKGVIFFKGSQYNNQVIKMELTEDFLSFYSAFNDSLLAYLPNPVDLTAAQIFAMSQIVWHQFDIESAYNASLTTTSAPLAEGVIGIVSPLNGNGIVWVWDGRNLSPLNNRNQYLVWEFDGSKLSPTLAARNHEEFSWDDNGFKPYWGGHPKNEWIWQGNILRQIWNANYNKEYLYEDGIIRPRFGGFGENEWEVQGDVPKAVVTAIVLGVLFR